jgi:hypothetical protein
MALVSIEAIDAPIKRFLEGVIGPLLRDECL